MTCAAGAVHALLFLLSYWLVTSEPGVTASNADLIAFYQSEAPRRLVVVGLYLMPFAGIAFMWFSVALRTWIAASGKDEDVLLSNIQLVSGILFVGLFFAAAAAAASIAVSVEYAEGPVDPLVARQLPSLGNTLMYVFAMRMAAMFIFATSNIGRRTHVLPSWFIGLGFAVGLFLMLSATFNQVLVLVFPMWVLVLSILLFVRARRLSTDLMGVDSSSVPADADTSAPVRESLGETT